MAEQTFESICERMEIPEGLRKHVAPEAPKKGKLAVARGILPAPPKALLAMQYMLVGDPDPEVVAEAERGLVAIPEERLLGLLDRTTHPKILEFLVYRRGSDRRLLETIALMLQVNDKTLCWLAEHGSERIVEMVAGNQERLITTPQLLRFLERNGNAGPAVLDRVRSFHRLYGIELPSIEVARAEAEARKRHQGEIAAAARAAEEAAKAKAVPAPSGVPRAGPPAAAPAAGGPSGPAAPPPPGPQPAWTAPGRGGLPWDFIPGEVYIPPAPQAPWTPPPGLVNPLLALLQDWGIPNRPDFVAPPDDVEHPGGAGFEPSFGAAGSATAQQLVVGPALVAAPVVDVASLTVDGAAELGIGIAAAADDEVDVSGMTSLAGSGFSFDFEEDDDEFGAEFVDENVEDDDEVKESVAKQVATMTVGQKIKLAYKGNKAVREILVRDANKIVGVAVIKSGRISEREVMAIACNRAINEDVIRALSANREYLRKYPVKVALAGNPKTPIPTAIGLLNGLHVKDLQQVATNRNVSAAVFTAAAKLCKARKTAQS